MPTPTLTAFVGRSFRDQDQELWNKLRDILDSFKGIRFTYEDAKGSKLASISTKVKEGIERNKIYIAVLSRRYPILDEQSPNFWQRCLGVVPPPEVTRWTTSDWVVEEVGYAIGRERPVIVLIEEGVDFPPSDLDADTEYIPFSRSDLNAITPKLNGMLLTMIARGIPEALEVEPSTSSQLVVEAEVAQKAEDSVAIRDSEPFNRMLAHAKAGESQKADEALQELLEDDTDPYDRDFSEATLHGFRVDHGDQSSLQWLERKANSGANTFAIFQLARRYIAWGQKSKACDLLDAKLPNTSGRLRELVLLQIAEVHRQSGNYAKATEALAAKNLEDATASQKTDSLLSLDHLGEAASDLNLRLAALEKAVQVDPLNKSARFSLGHLYLKADRSHVAAFHNRMLVLTEDSDGAAMNNLAVAYSKIGITDLEIEALLSAKDRTPLAKANLATRMAQAGFLTQAVELAKEAVASDDDDAIERGNVALTLAAEMRATSKKVVDDLESTTREEREFRPLFADAYLDALPTPAGVLVPFPFGSLNVVLKGNELIGESSELHSPSPRATGLRGLAGTSKKNIKFRGTLHGRAGTFRAETGLTFGAETASSILTTTVYEGVMVVDADLCRWTMLKLAPSEAAVWRLEADRY